MPILRDFDSHERNVEGANGLCENHFPWPWLSKARTHSHFPAWLQEPVYSNGMLDESSGATQGKQIQGQRKPSFCHLQPQTSRALPGRTQPRLIVVNYSGILDTVPCHKGSTSRVGAPALSPLAPDVMAGRHSKPSSPTSVSTKALLGLNCAMPTCLEAGDEIAHHCLKMFKICFLNHRLERSKQQTCWSRVFHYIRWVTYSYIQYKTDQHPWQSCSLPFVLLKHMKDAQRASGPWPWNKQVSASTATLSAVKGASPVSMTQAWLESCWHSHVRNMSELGCRRCASLCMFRTLENVVCIGFKMI